MKFIVSIFILIQFSSFAQIDENYLNEFLIDCELSDSNKLEKYKSFDFSQLWLKTPNSFVYGIIGNEGQRIRIKLVSVIKNLDKQNQYFVYGKSQVKDNVCEFQGLIEIVQIKEVKELYYGIDEIYRDSSIIEAGVVFANYKFLENKTQNHVGIFQGTLLTKWYLTKNGNLHYDDVAKVADSYTNNSFIGTWVEYNSEESKSCNWADYRVPLSPSGFDIGAGEFSPADEYLSKGWLSYRKGYFENEEKYRKMEESIWWK